MAITSTFNLYKTLQLHSYTWP